MSIPENKSAFISANSEKAKIDDLPRHVMSYGTRKIIDGVRMGGLIEGIRLAGKIYSLEGELLGSDPHPLEDEYLTSDDVPGVLGQLAAKNKFGN